MSDEQAILVCHRAAEAVFVTRTTSYDQKCSHCGERVALAGSSQAYLKAHPETTILCYGCHRPKPGDRATPATDEATARAEIAATIPNTWRQRN